MLLSRMLKRVIRIGRLTVLDPSGRQHVFGPGGKPEVTVRLHGRRTVLRLFLNPAHHVGEAYMNGTLTIEKGSLHDFLHVCTFAEEASPERHPVQALRKWFMQPLRILRQYTPVWRARRNVAHHYDLSGALYDLFLDEDRQYSCAYFPEGNESLEEAQEKKKRHIAAKLLLEPGMSVLDIGSGWGGLALHLARSARAHVTGITLSQEQLKVSRERAAAAGMGERARFLLRDYREEKAAYDRIVSVGMFEHVGVAQYRTFFETLRHALKPDGIALVHAIGRMAPPGEANSWLDKHIFPGGYTPALSEVLAAIERSGLWVTDIEILRLHYAETLRHWFNRFQANRDRIEAIYDERFCRMWEFYLAGCEMAFRNGPEMVFQIQLARRRDAVPLSRDYIVDRKRGREMASAVAA